MQSSRKPRRSFAAPLILSVAAVPACVVTSSKPATSTKPTDPEQRDHRQKDPETTDHRQPDGDPVVISNPPRPTQFVERTNTKYDESWSLKVESDGSCKAYAEASCPANSKCNPPAPRPVACPDGIAAGESWSLWADAGSSSCQVMAPGGDCPVGASCNPPPPQKASCPE